MQPTTQEATKDTDGNRVNVGRDVPTETITMGSVKRTMQGDEKGKDEGEGKHVCGVTRTEHGTDLSHDSKNSETSIQTHDKPMAQEDLEPSQTDVKIHAAPTIMSH